MDPVVTLTDEHLVVEPGGEVSTVVRVRNTSDVITEYDLAILGEMAAYTEIVPAQLSVYVGDMMEATIIIRPPYDTMISSGHLPFAVTAQSREDNDRIGLVEGELTVGAINLLQTKILPTRTKGRWRAKSRLEIHNQGTEEMTVRLRTVDPDEKLSFALAPRELQVAAGETADSFLKIRPRKSMILGSAVHLPFEISYRRKAGARDAYLGATTAGETEAFVQSSFEQKPIIARWMMAAFAVFIILTGLFIYRATTTEIDATPERPVEAPRPPANVQIAAEIGTVTLTWDAPEPPPASYRVLSLDPQRYAAGEVDLVEEPDVPDQIDPLQRSVQVAVEEGTRKCFFVQSVAEEGPRSVIVGSASPNGLVKGNLPAGNCADALSRDRCDAPSVSDPVPERDLGNKRAWTVTWSYGEGCETAGDAIWTVSVNGEVQQTLEDPASRQSTLDLSGPPQSGVYRVTVSPREGDPGTEVTVAAPEVESEEQRLENLEQGIVTPRRHYAIVTGLNPASGLPLTGPDSVEAWFEQIARALTSDESSTQLPPSRIVYGPVVESELPDDDRSNMRVIELSQVDDPTSYFLVVDDFATIGEAEALCGAVDSLVDSVTAAFEEQVAELGAVRPPDPCRAVSL